MKILHVAASLGLRHGGVSVSVRSLCRYLAQQGVEVHVWTTPRAYEPSIDGPADQDLQLAGVRIRYFPVHPFSLLGQRYAYSPALASALRKEVSSFDLVHFHGVWLYTTDKAAAICHAHKVPYVVSPCGALEPYSVQKHRWFKQFYGRWVTRTMLQRAALIHFTSDLEQSQAVLFGAHPRGAVIPCPLPEGACQEYSSGKFRQKYPEVGPRRILLFISRLHPKKRLDIVCEAFIAVAHSYDDLHLVVAGLDEGVKKAAQRQLEEAGLSARATFPGLVTGQFKWETYRDSTLFLLPSEEENFGIVVLEAMAMGLPVVVSDRVGLSSAVIRWGAGRVLPLQLSEWIGCLRELLGSRELCQKLGERGRLAARSEFGAFEVAGAMRKAYRGVLGD